MIHIIDYFNSDVRHMNHWQTIVKKSLQDAGYDVNIIGGTNPNLALASLGLLGDAYYKTTQFERVYDELITEGISQGDIFIFTDAWNPTLTTLKYMSLVLDLDIKLIGIWREGIYDLNSKIRTGLLRKPKDWAKTFERSLYNAYDRNCFVTPMQKKRFMGRYGLREIPTTHVTGLPYSGLLELKKSMPVVEKEDIIVLPHDATDEDQRDIFKALRNYLKGYKFIDCHELGLLDREYYAVLNKAKAVMAINLSEADPTNIYEGMVFDCIPIIPDRLVYKDVFPEEYHYPTFYTQPPFLNFVRGRDVMHDRVEAVIKNYDELVVGMRHHTERIGNEFFNTDRLLEVIRSINE